MARATGGTSQLETAEVNRLILAFGDSVKRFFRDQQRSTMTSPMFNLPGRLVLGSHCYFENLPRLLSLVGSRAQPAEIGARMKRLCGLPNYVHLNSLALGFLVGREQARLTGARVADDAAAVAGVMDFWAEVARAYRNDGLLLPDEADFSVPILAADTVRDLDGRLRREIPDAELRQLRRMLATLELYTFILHGEARVGVFHHGPYPLGDGSSIVVRELIGLREDFYPWAQLESRPFCDHLACVMRLRDVRSKIVLFGTLTTEPADFWDRVEALEVFVVGEEGCEPLPAADAPRLTALAADAQNELYRRVIDWDDRYRIEYGADLYACLLRTFGGLLGFGEAFGREIRSAFADSIDRHLEDLYSGREQPLVLQHIASTPGPVFSPLAS